MSITQKVYKIGIYIRVSTQEQAENPEGSIRNQEERLKAAIKLKNMQDHFGDLVEIFVDKAKSGKDTNRKSLQRLLRKIEKNEIDLVMVTELSRLSRNIRDFTEMWEMMKKQGCSFLSLRENFDTTTAAGEMLLYSLANLSQFERRQISERVAANMMARAERGLYNGGPLAFGFLRDENRKGHLLHHPEESKIVRKAYKAFLEHETLAQTAKWLNQNGYHLRRQQQGGQVRSRYFSIDNLHKILTNKIYIGMKVFTKNGKKEVVKACWNGMVDDELFYRVGSMLKKNRSTKKAPSKRRYPYLLSGRIVCSCCGGILCGKSAHGRVAKVGYYEHNDVKTTTKYYLGEDFACEAPRRSLAKRVHALVLEKTREMLSSEEMARKLFDRLKEVELNDPNLREKNALLERAGLIAGQLDALVERLAELPKGVSASPIYEKMKVLEVEKGKLEKKRQELEAGNIIDEPITVKSWLDFGKSVAPLLHFQEGDSLKREKLVGKILSKLIHKVEIGRNSIKIHYFMGQDHIKKAALGGAAFILTTCSTSLTNGTADRN